MCGIVGIFGTNVDERRLRAMVAVQNHRGPDAQGIYLNAAGTVGLGHNRLSIIDLSEAGRQPMKFADGRLMLVFNGEIYNYLELRAELESEYQFRTRTDTEVLLAAYEKWGARCLEKLIGMFAFVIWDEHSQTAFAARDRFGVKPFYYHQKPDGTLLVASEIKTLHAAGVRREPNAGAWATYLTYGLCNHTDETFWENIEALPPGHALTWRSGDLKIERWYDLAEKVDFDFDARSEAAVKEEYFELLKESVNLRFRADVPVGINLSGGVDSSTLLGLVHAVQGADSNVKVFTFTTGDENYDELPWVSEMLAQTNHPLTVCQLNAEEVPRLAADVQRFQDEPFGGIPTLAYAKLFERARAEGVIVLLDGNGLDEQWAGYDYYRHALGGAVVVPSIVQGANSKPVRPDCLQPEFRALATAFEMPEMFPDKMRNLQYRDVRYSKIPRAMRFNDRVSMRSSTELREPFLDHRLFELAFRQPAERKISNGTHKYLLRQITRQLLPEKISGAPKRPLQTPQREWLRGELREWAAAEINQALQSVGGVWLEKQSVQKAWAEYCEGASDNSFYVWQWINLSLAINHH
jgi:asparagine synthase (glutamine-hydrolysing)